VKPFLIVNPKSAAGRTGRHFDRIARAVRAAIGDFECAFTRARGDGSRLAREAVRSGGKLVVAVGGDGTASEVVDGLALGTPRDPDAPVREALDSPFDLSGVPLRLAVYAFEERTPGRYRCLLTGEMDVRALGFREEAGRSVAAVDLAFTTVGRDGSTTEHAQRVEMKLLPATREKLARDGYLVTREVELPAGVHQARMVVRDVATGRVGSVSHRVDLPPAGSFRMSTPLVSDALEPVPKGTPPRLVPIARREFRAGGRVFLSVDVFGAERGDVSGLPRVSMGYEVIRPDGEVLTRLDLKRIDPTADGALHRIVGFVVEDALPGEYRIEGQVVDEQSGKTLVFTEPFTVRGPAPSPGS